MESWKGLLASIYPSVTEQVLARILLRERLRPVFEGFQLFQYLTPVDNNTQYDIRLEGHGM